MSLRNLFAKTKIRCSRQRYIIVGLEKEFIRGYKFLHKIKPFSSITIEKDEISLVVPERLWTKYFSYHKNVKYSGPYRLITFDTTIDLDVCGYFAAISKLMAESRVSIFPISTYKRDHIMVRENDCKKALAKLRYFIRKQRT